MSGYPRPKRAPSSPSVRDSLIQPSTNAFLPLGLEDVAHSRAPGVSEVSLNFPTVEFLGG